MRDISHLETLEVWVQSKKCAKDIWNRAKMIAKEVMKNRLVQIALSVALLVLLIQVVLIAPSQIRDSENKAALMPAPEIRSGSDVDQTMSGMHMIETQEGQKEWELWSAKATSLKAKDMMQLDSVKALFFSDSGVTFTVTGKKGIVQTKSKNLRVEGDVVTRSSNGYVFRTQSMEYNSVTRLLTAENAVDMQGPKDANGHSLRLNGVGMEASLPDGTMEVLSSVKAEKSLDRGRRALIKSQRSFFNGKDRSAKFIGEVVLDMDSMRITGPEAKFDYDQKSQSLKTVNFSGGARVSDSDRWATAQNLKVDFEDNRFVFKGNPRVVQNNDELRGEEIIFLDGGKRVQVKGARAKVDQKKLEKVN